MVKHGCSIEGNLNDASFSEPLPWIGIYIASASLACAVAMAADLIHGFRHQKLWFPSRYFAINATTLTVMAVAIKLSVDLNTAMPSRAEQLAKISSSALICTVMGNSIPSLGSMETKEMFMNVMALAILVITVVVNICIQLGTGVIYLYWQEHAFIMFLMLVLLLILSFSAFPVPITKRYLESKHKKRYDIALKEGSNETCGIVDKKLKDDLMKFWMMAHTCSPQFVLGRSVTCTASGALCLLNAMTLAETMLRSYLMSWSFKFCIGESDYKWSTFLVLIAQTIAVGVGTVAPAIRWFTAVNFMCPTIGKKSCKRVFTVERYWIQCFLELKECPSLIQIQNRRCRKLAHGAKNRILDLCIGMQTGIVLACKAIQYVSVYFVGRLILLCHSSRKLFKPRNIISVYSESTSQTCSKPDLSRFVLHLEGENELVHVMMKKNRDATDHWMQRGENEQPKYLIELVGKSTFSEGFRGVERFDSDLVPSLSGEEPPNCWALPIATLTAIAIALPNVGSSSHKWLIHSVHEGLMYVNLLEDNMDAKGDLINIRKAASVVWLGVDLFHKWLDVDLHELSQQADCTKEILNRLANAAKNRFVDFKKTQTNQCLAETPAKWPIKVLAANSMYRISQTVLKISENGHNLMGERLFDALTVMISDLHSACLTNLSRVILLKCLNSTIEEREESVRHAVFLLGKTKKILKLLEHKVPHHLCTAQLTCIDEWRALHKLKNPLHLVPPSEESNTNSLASNDFHLTIEQDL